MCGLEYEFDYRGNHSSETGEKRKGSYGEKGCGKLVKNSSK